MTDRIYSQSQLPIRRSVDLLPEVFKTEANSKFLAGVLDPLIQPGVLEKTVGYVGRRYGKTFKSNDVYLDTDQTLRSRYQLEPAVVIRKNDRVENFYDYIDFKNQLKFFGNTLERDDLFTEQDHYSWNPPVEWDKFVNYREYFWVPMGPPTVRVLGQAQNVTSTYRVRLGDSEEWILTPDGLTPNPTITLYRGQTYVFNVNAPRNNFYIRSAPDVGMAANWTKGVTNSGTENGKVTFKVPVDAPDVLYYQSNQEPNRHGRILVDNIESNSKINIIKEVVGKQTYTSSNGIKFTNGLVVEFIGQVTPAKYSSGRWLVEGVGEAISLVNFTDLRVPVINQNNPEVLFDNSGFDTEPFDDASAYPGTKDYITINRSSIDSNPWSRYNRWFHRSVLEYSHSLNGTDVDLAETARAKRPIIEFKANLQLFNHGAIAKTEVDYIDTYTKDVLSTVEGSPGYSIDNEFIFEGARILFIADTDNWVNNKIYTVNFITHNNRKQISLVETADAVSTPGECVLVRRGKANAGLMFHFDGTTWNSSQPKTAVNQPPLFEIVDATNVSLGDKTTYPVSSFVGSKLVSYKIGTTGTTDAELGFKLSYLNIDNVGDIQFNFDWDLDTFTWQSDRTQITQPVNAGYYLVNNPLDISAPLLENGWTLTDRNYLQPIIYTETLTVATSTVSFKACEWTGTTNEKIIFYVNGELLTAAYTRPALDTFVFSTTFKVGDSVTIKVYSDQNPDQGYYEIPLGLERNPLNSDLLNFTLGQASNHAESMVELADEFAGSFPGVSNLRDLAGYQHRGRRFLKHAGTAAFPITALCSKDGNLIKSIQYAKKSYTDFKNNFLTLASDLFYDQDVTDFVDDILREMTKSKSTSDQFSDSDMVGNGAYTKIEYVVEDEGIKTFALNEKFDLETLRRRAVYVYINGVQLLVEKDYAFNSNFGFVTITRDLVEGDAIEIREYVSTAYSYIPSTPTALGMYKRFTPMIFIDDTYQTPTKVIQGHDGSLTIAYDDIRDEVLLELEKRIYNNIKIKYDPTVFDIDQTLGGYYGNSTYGKSEVDNIVNGEFLKWVANADVDFVSNQYFDEQNSFTYTYSNMTDPTKQQSLPGFWRGVYMWFYDTDRPHVRPWEMLGFSEMPTWWESEYGAAPYTSGNMLLWEDLEAGVIRQGNNAGIHDRYKRPGLTTYIPVDGNGKLLSPLDSGLAQDFSLINNRGDFVLGDISPAEAAWRRSSEWPFAVSMALCLLRPFDYIIKHIDSSQLTKNNLGQFVDVDSVKFTQLSDLAFPENGQNLSVGLINWIIDYLRSRKLTSQVIIDILTGLDVNITNRIQGFVDQAQQKYLLDSKNPKSTSSSIFIPNENYDIFFNVSVPISTISYSGVILEKKNTGWKVTGYDNSTPYFNYFTAVPTQTDPLIAVGGVTDAFVDWAAGKYYNNGQIVRNNSFYYRTIKSHTSGDKIDPANFKQLPKLPQVGAVEALKRRNFNTTSLSQLNYGTVLTTVQQVVDFLLGYEQYLKSIGMTFDQYDSTSQSSKDWFTSAKEFMFWTKHNWAEGSLLTMSPAADLVAIDIPVGVADNLLDNFYDYQIYKSDGTPLQPRFVNVNRDIQKIAISKTNTTDGIYFIKINFVLKEHVVVFTDRTVFNDVIYDKTTGYRQDRIKVRGFRTTDWDGDYTSPGFLFDNVNIQTWTPFTDYKLGDIVAYREFYWTSQVNQDGSSIFDASNWSKLDLIPSKGLVSNFDYKINQFDDYYDLDADGVGSSQRDLGRHAVGYQQRDYLQNIAEDEVSQFKLYQGFIREKGTQNSITKVFDKLSNSTGDSVTLYEEWAFRVGRFGGTDQVTELEFKINKPDLQINPQPVLIVNSLTSDSTDKYIRLSKSDFTISATPYSTNINPMYDYTLPGRSAGYVKNDQIEFIVKTRDDILNLDINQFRENDNVWVTFDGYDWNVLRYNISNLVLKPTGLLAGNVLDPQAPFVKVDNDVTINLDRRHNLSVGDIIGIRDVSNLTGFFKITAADLTTLTVTVPANTPDPELNNTSIIRLRLFTSARYKNYSGLDFAKVGVLAGGSKLWIDQNGNNQWEVIEKVNQFTALEVLDFGITDPTHVGQTSIYVESLKQIIASISDKNYVVTYNAARPALTPIQFIAPSTEFADTTNKSFGSSIAVSADNRWMVIGAPLASGVQSAFRGIYNGAANYAANDIVLFNGSLWTAVNSVFGDGSTINLSTMDWKPTVLTPADGQGTNTGYSEQGSITFYEWGNVESVSVTFDPTVSYPIRTIVTYIGRQYISLVNTVAGTLPTDIASWATASGRWNERLTVLSPRQSIGERFGSALAIAGSNGEYTLAVSAPNSLEGTGRVYLYTYTADGWQHLQEPGYAGGFTTATSYVAGSIAWFNNSLWKALVDFTADGVTTPATSTSWVELGDVSVQNILPSSPALVEDGSTLEIGLSSTTDLIELIKKGDQFGFSLGMNSAASTLVVGAPNSDDQYFENYKGSWEAYQTYVTNDVVKSGSVYYKVKSTVESSTNEDPATTPASWVSVANVTAVSTGKVFVYKKNAVGKFELAQTINTGSLVALGLNPGDKFGFNVDLDATGNTLIVAAPFADINYQNQGSVFVFALNSSTGLYEFTQKLESYDTVNNENFGNSISISSDSKRIAIGAQNSPYKINVTWTTPVTFDAESTTFSKDIGSTGQVYVFERKDSVFVLAEKLDVPLEATESFGASVDATNSAIVVTSPTFKVDNVPVGKVRFFTKTLGVDSWKTLTVQEQMVNIDLLKSLSVYDTINNVKLADVDIVDHFKLKILGVAEEEIKFKTPYDPATYMVGTDSQIVDADQAWFEKNVGAVWWDVSTAKWVWYEQGDVAYRTGNWNQLAAGASIDVYEWVESILLPSEWASIADTNEGLAEGISGQPMYADDTVYNFKEEINSTTGAITGTKYYFWVKNKTVVPNNPQRKIAASEVASLIANPIGTGYPVVALIGADKLLAYNFGSLITGDYAVVNLQYAKTLRNLNEIHSEYHLLAEGDVNSKIPESLETKWIDSLLGFDIAGNQVPDPNLSAKQKYGIDVRPRQSMFIDRTKALRIVIDRVNATLLTQPFIESLSLSNLNKVDPVPDVNLNLYDQSVPLFIDLETVGTARLRQAILRANIIDGEIDTIDIVDAGFGYKVAPPIDIQGTGSGAEAIAEIDNQGRVVSVKVVQPGKKYSSAILRVRSFSVLVVNDSTSNNFWTIYAWDQKSKAFYRSKTQEYNTANYWDKIDWWATGYGVTSRIVSEVSSLFYESTLTLTDGDLLRVKEYGEGGWAVLARVTTGGEILGKYTLVGRELGTLQLQSTLYDTTINNVGYDNVGSYDSIPYDQQPVTELRNIFTAIKEDILIDELSVEWNTLFFASIGYVFSEQFYVDWAFKTSFMSAIHNVGDLAKKTNYKNDNLESFKDYINEVKPYRTKIREYTSQYTELQLTDSAVTDFDNPAVYSVVDGKAIPVTLESEQSLVYPWKWWTDNRGYSVVDIQLATVGEGYTTIPTVIIESSTGTGATAQAYIANGRVSGIKLLTQGSDYLTAPTVKLVGGNGSNTPARAVAILGDGKVRNFNMSIKFDRISKTGIFSSLTHDETFTATGYTSVFDLSFAPTRDKSKIAVLKNGELVFNSEYTISLYTSTTDTYSLLKGKIQFNSTPAKGDKIVVSYEKNDLLLDATNRIEKFYSPTTGMLGFNTEHVTIQITSPVVNSQIIEVPSAKDIREGMRVTGTGVVPSRVMKIVSGGHIVVSEVQNLPTKTILEFAYNNPNQLMTGVDFGGVMIQGNPFDVTGGWDALPWFTDSWDSVESSADVYIVADGSTGYVTLPNAPADGQLISIYIQRSGETTNVRIDDPYFSVYDGVTVQPNGRTTAPVNAVMDSFIGDGTNKIVDLPNSLTVNAGDTLIFRTSDSDGTVTVTDVNLIDTNLSGGTLETMRGAYITATGRNAEDIIVDGEQFISPDQVPATEENVPGQVLDSVSIKVFHSKFSGSPTVLAKVAPTVAGKKVYDIGQSIIEPTGVMVYVNKVKKTNYKIDFGTNQIIFNTAPAAGNIIEIISVGIGGLALLDYKEFTTNGTDRLFLTGADYKTTASVLVTVNGNHVDALYTNSRGQVNNSDKTLVEIALPPEAGSIVKIVVLGATLDNDTNQEPVIRVNQQTIIIDASTRSYPLDNFVDLGRSSARGSILVELNQVNLRSSDTEFIVYDGTNNVVSLGNDPFTPAGSIAINDLKVYKNDQLIGYISDWTFDGTANELELLQENLAIGDKIRIEQNINTDYSIENGNIVLSQDLQLVDNDVLLVTWFNEYPSVDLIKEVYTGGKSEYPLSRKPLSISYLWVYQNGQRLTQDIDYLLSVVKNVVILLAPSTLADRVEIVQFGADTYQQSVAYEVFKDMLNTHHFKRYSINAVKLAAPLAYYDQTITVTDATDLGIPNARRRVPGIVEINGERIEYFTKTGNVLGQLRRGSLGTPIAELHVLDSHVVDLGTNESIPYIENQEKIDLISDGSTIEFGPFDFISAKPTSTRSFYRITALVTNNDGTTSTLYPSIPSNYVACDEVEIFVGGKRLNKDPITVFEEGNAASSPEADITLEADFSVNRSTKTIRLTNAVPAGIRITILRRAGRTWYEQGDTSASKGVTLLDNDTVIFNFIEQKTTLLP